MDLNLSLFILLLSLTSSTSSSDSKEGKMIKKAVVSTKNKNIR
ncbi:hypothetical protein GCM10010917_43350 [Paenibacillus physcomitrellae]|uniref:Uncharacterized protein n=1 Tax=Paenibacillus physcomitrellae TaxID=1619311 RepID=A0ABQ1H071_9BACL|nr:hypothetical protein GCM10010917_43350 [Paenibacillus physcomitrellae]GGJ33210.1 hypothetical protein GCM10008022_47410 [Paenibacillus hunanensis]